MNEIIHGIAISNYKSFGPELQHIAPLKKINVIIGKNNSGKSNILHFVRTKCLESTTNFYNAPLGAAEKHTDFKQSPKFGIGVEIITSNQIAGNNINWNNPVLKSMVSENNSKKLLWLYYTNEKWSICPAIMSELIRERLHSNESTFFGPILELAQNIKCSSISSTMTSEGAQHNLKQILFKLPRELINLPKPNEILYLPAKRKIVQGEFSLNDYSGPGLIKKLNELKEPDYLAIQNQKLFNKINTFLCGVLNKKAQVRIPHHLETIHIEMDDKVLPLEALGTGIHEVIILAVISTINENKVICIEEPEIHLHPGLQKRLIEYLQKETSNQYIISTHSASFVDAPDVAIFHVTHDGKSTRVEQAYSPNSKSNICFDLGYRASDILQTNCIIWVEGPSDRTYINYWIQHKDPKLIEGLHYSVMFYGGRLLSHLSADDEEVSNFIELRKLNRNIAIIFDSDKKSSQTALNSTKDRVKNEITQNGGFVWETLGREIENYLPSKHIEDAIINQHPTAKPCSTDQYDHVFQYTKGTANKIHDADKIKLAKFITEKFIPDFSILDLDKQIACLAQFIRKSNEID